MKQVTPSWIFTLGPVPLSFWGFDKIPQQKATWEERSLFGLYFKARIYHWGDSWQELKARAMDKFYLQLTQLPFLYHPALPSEGWCWCCDDGSSGCQLILNRLRTRGSYVVLTLDWNFKIIRIKKWKLDSITILANIWNGQILPRTGGRDTSHSGFRQKENCSCFWLWGHSQSFMSFSNVNYKSRQFYRHTLWSIWLRQFFAWRLLFPQDCRLCQVNKNS